MVLANLAQENNIGDYVKHYMVSNRQDNSERKGFMKFLQNLALLVHLLMIAYISRRKRQIVLIILVYVNDMAVATPKNIYITSFKIVLHNDFDITNLGELKFMLEILVKKLIIVLTNLSFSANLHTFTKSSLTLAYKILHLFLLH